MAIIHLDLNRKPHAPCVPNQAKGFHTLLGNGGSSAPAQEIGRTRPEAAPYLGRKTTNERVR